MYKRFPGVEAISDVDLDLYAGECLAICGENGAGKSTLIKLLGGALTADAGEIFLFGDRVEIRSPAAAQEMGISIIYQEFNLIPELTARENIFLGREETRFGFPTRRKEAEKSRVLFQRMGLTIDPESRCSELNIAEQQAVEIAKALSWKARVIVMDEPSATLTEPETRRLFEVIHDLKSAGIGIIYISHRIEEIFEVAERVMVLRDGRLVSENRTNEVDRRRLINLMVGRSVETEFPSRTVELGAEVLCVKNLRRGGSVRGVSFSVREGEVLGFAGLVGAGRTDTVRLIFGADRLESGSILIDGRVRQVAGPRDAIRNGICLLTEDRKAQGLVLGHSARENFGLPNLDRFSHHVFIDKEKERKALAKYVRALRIDLNSPEQPVGTLSGGNQQKVVLAKWLVRNSRIVLFDEPTRGIDVGAKYEIYLLINELASQGKAIIMISSELPEILGMSDRIIVMHEGEVKGEITDVDSATQEQILSTMVS
jgi:ABC-type sugar transport system ATPase subunit